MGYIHLAQDRDQGSCKHSNETSRSVESEELLVRMNNYELVEKGPFHKVVYKQACK